MLITGGLWIEILLADAAQMSRGYTQVSGYLGLRHILLYLRMLAYEVKITLGGCAATKHTVATQQRPVGRLHKQPPLITHIRVLFIHGREYSRIDGINLGLASGNQVKRCGLIVQAIRIVAAQGIGERKAADVGKLRPGHTVYQVSRLDVAADIGRLATPTKALPFSQCHELAAALHQVVPEVKV